MKIKLVLKDRVNRGRQRWKLGWQRGCKLLQWPRPPKIRMMKQDDGSGNVKKVIDGAIPGTALLRAERMGTGRQ